jgi:hypothetical protein
MEDLLEPGGNGRSSSTDRGHTVGFPDEPDDTATMSQASSRPLRHN